MSIQTKIERYLYNIVEKNRIKDLITKYKDVPKVLYLLTPTYTNLGDHAIAISNEKIIKKKYEEYLFLEFSYKEYKKNKKLIKKLIKNEDIIILPGGGNLGTIYSAIEEERREIIRTYLKNKIIIMPQSIFFKEDKLGKEYLKKTIEIYSKNKNLHIIARDFKSFKYGEDYFQANNVYLAPDSVFYLAEETSKIKKEDILLIFRNDCEKNISDNISNEIKSNLEKNKISFREIDTCLNYNFNRETREYELNKYLLEVSRAKLVITDRFHGVIFSILTNTPVIVFKSLDHKIEEGIKWFDDLEWVYYNPTINEIEKIIKKYNKEDYYLEGSNKLKYLKEKLEEVFYSI